MEINIKKQREIFNRLESLIHDNKNLMPHKLVKLVLDFLLNEYYTDPIISSINEELWEYLMRRAPRETIEKHNMIDKFVIEKLSELGIKFKVNTSLAVNTVQAVFMLAISIANEEESEEVIDIILEGIIEKIVEE